MGRPKSFVRKKPGFDYRFKRGIRLVEEMLVQTGKEDNIKKIMERFAEIALINAVEYYDSSNTGKHNLTGNTRFSFCAGIYKDGVQPEIIKVLNLVGGKHTFQQVNVGSRGFMDYDRNEFVTGVKDYSDPNRHFIEVGSREFSYLQTMTWLKQQHPTNTKGYSVIVASVSPYVEYIHQWLELDILDSSRANAENDMAEAIRSVIKSK